MTDKVMISSLLAILLCKKNGEAALCESGYSCLTYSLVTRKRYTYESLREACPET